MCLGLEVMRGGDGRGSRQWGKVCAMDELKSSAE